MPPKQLLRTCKDVYQLQCYTLHIPYECCTWPMADNILYFIQYTRKRPSTPMSVDSLNNLVGKVISVSVLRFVIGTDHLPFICGRGCCGFFQARTCFAFKQASKQAFVGKNWMIFSHPEPMLEKLGDGQGGQPYQYELSQFAQKEPFSIRSIQTSVEQRVVGYKQDMIVMCQRHPTHISTAIAI